MRLLGSFVVVFGAVSASSVLGCAANTTSGETTPVANSAAALERSPCPQHVRVGVDGIDADADWRQVGEPGLRYCVPASWVRFPHRRGDQWSTSTVSVAAANSSNIENDFPRTPLSISARRGYFKAVIGGYEVEYWYQAFEQPSPYAQPSETRSVARTPEYTNGYQMFAVWRDAEVVMNGYAMTMSGVAALRAVVQTVRFDSATAAPAGR